MLRLIVLVAALTVPVIGGYVPCTEGGFERSVCPTSAPVCCTWPETGVHAACCPAGFTCDLADGTCIFFNNATNHSTTNTSGVAPEGGVNMGISAAAALLTLGSMAFLFLCALSAVAGYRCFVKYRAHVLRRREEEAALLADEEQDEEEGGNAQQGANAANDDDGDDATTCQLCYARRREVIFLPCGHVSCCGACAKRLKNCAICRAEIKKIVKIQRKQSPLPSVPQPLVSGASATDGAAAEAAPRPDSEITPASMTENRPTAMAEMEPRSTENDEAAAATTTTPRTPQNSD